MKSLLIPDDKYLDVTAQVMAAIDRIDPGSLKVSQYLDMLEGTRALEIGNKALDTGLIELLPADLSFDCSQGRPLAEVNAIMNSVLRALVAWLDGLSLLVTVLSSRYVYDMLSNFKKNLLLSEAVFINRRIHPDDYVLPDTEESAFVNIVLRGYVIGLVKLLSILYKIALDVLYEEEDITTRSMDFDYFCTTPLELVYEPLDAAIDYLTARPSDDVQNTALLHLQFIKLMLQLHQLLNDTVELFLDAKPLDTQYLRDSVTILEKLKSQSYVDIPELLVSRFVQVDCNNRHIPCENVTLSREIALGKLIEIINAVEKIMIDLPLIKNESQLQIYLSHNVGQQLATSANAIVRGFFQLFFIRDDRSIVGLMESVSSLAIQCMESLCLVHNSIMVVEEWNIEGSSHIEDVKSECLTKLTQLLDDIDAAFYQKLTVYGNNRSRQRQLLTRNLILWDTLQYNSENVEGELHSHGIGDRLTQQGAGDQPALAISSFVYYEKLNMMAEVVLTGFEQDIYSDFEADIMYWYAGELFAHIHQHASGRLRDINVSKLAWCQNFPKKIKKAKGPKKDALKQLHGQLSILAVPRLETNIAILDNHILPKTLTYYYLCRAIAMAIQLFRYFLNPEKKPLWAEDEKLYRLRMKPWSSIGTPELPDFARYKESNNIQETLGGFEGKDRDIAVIKVAKNIETELQSVKKSCQEVVKKFVEDEKVRDRLLFGKNEYMKTWETEITETCNSYLEQLEALQKHSEQKKYKMVRCTGSSPLFPIYQLKQ